MSPQTAREILLLYRPGSPDNTDPQMVEALSEVRRDPDLARWFEQHCVFQEQMRKGLRQIAVPAHLNAACLAGPKIVHPRPWWRRPQAWQALAAALVLLLGLSAFWLKSGAPNRFDNFQARMVGAVLREYRMDVVTHDMGRLRQFAAAQGAPADYQIPKGLEKLQLTGGGRLGWRSNPVTMVCFDRGDNQMLYLFVMRHAALKDPPPQSPRLARVHDVAAVSWTQGENTYLLTGPEEAGFLQKYL